MKRLLECITRKKRYYPEIKWSRGSWTHNVFRCWEWFAGRKVGIRAELTSVRWKDEDGWHSAYFCHSFESVFALFEQQIRELLKWREYMPSFVWLPSMKTPEGIPFIGSPFMLAIAVDATDTVVMSSSSSPMTNNHTVTGSNCFLAIGGAAGGLTSQSTFTAGSYNSVAATEAKAQQVSNTPLDEAAIYFLGNPSTGTHQWSLSATLGTAPGMAGTGTSYTGAQSSSVADAVNSVSGTTTGDKTFTVTTIADNCWIYCVGLNQAASSPTIAADQTTRGSLTYNMGGIAGCFRSQDTNAALTPPGAQTVGMTIGGSSEQCYAICGASFAPFTAPVATVTSIPGNLISDGVEFSGGNLQL